MIALRELLNNISLNAMKFARILHLKLLVFNEIVMRLLKLSSEKLKSRITELNFSNLINHSFHPRPILRYF